MCFRRASNRFLLTDCNCYRLLEILKEFRKSVLPPHLCLRCRGGLSVFLWGGTTEFMTIGMDI